jgi:pyruvate,water dikinase
VHAALDDCPDLSLLPADALVREYRDLVRRLVTRWDAPLINDFFAMIFYGTLGRLCSRWCQDESQTLSNELLCASGGMVSTEPVIRMQRMASLARRDSELVELLQHAPAEEIIAGMASHDEFRREYDAYLAKFGERCNEELKLESQSLLDDPLTLLRAVGLLATQNHEARPKVANGAASPRATAEARVDEAFARRPLQRAVFRWVLRNARRTIRNRENLRLERTRVFGRVRRIFVELGKRLYESAILGDPHDVFYLQVNEVVAFVEGTAVTTDLCALAELRRAEFARYEAEADPPTRFETLGAVYLDRTSVSQIETPLADDGDLRAGMGCCPGRVRGRVRVVTDPRNAILERGDVLVAERTDPGWILLFPFAAGLLVERGNLLSHSAIVARELGIPAIVAIDGVTRWLKDGDVVEFDGASGVVQRTAAAEAAR